MVTALMIVLLPRPGAPYWSTTCASAREKNSEIHGGYSPTSSP